jgi:hypothetical protein
VVDDTCHGETDLADRGIETFIGLVAEQGNLIAYLAQLAALGVEPAENYRLAQHDAKERYRRTLLGKGAAQIDPKVEELRTILQRMTRVSVNALDPRTGHMRIYQRQSKRINHLTLEIYLKQRPFYQKNQTFVAQLCRKQHKQPSTFGQIFQIVVQPVMETKSR